MTDCTVHWEKHWDAEPIINSSTCRHPATAALSINQRLEPRGRNGQSIIAMDGSICMNCGIDVQDRLSLRDGLALAYQEHSWDYRTAERLRALVAFHEVALWEGNERLPLWFAYAWDWPWPRIKAALDAALAQDAGT